MLCPSNSTNLEKRQVGAAAHVDQASTRLGDGGTLQERVVQRIVHGHLGASDALGLACRMPPHVDRKYRPRQGRR